MNWKGWVLLFGVLLLMLYLYIANTVVLEGA